MRRRLFVHYINLGDTPPGPEMAINVVVDDSGSMSGDPIAAVRAALRGLIESMPEAARIGLVAFGTQVKVLAEPTEHREYLVDQVERFQGDSGSTMLWDAVGEASRRFVDDHRHRYVLTLTDGGDTGSAEFSLSERPTKKTSLIRFAIANRVKVFAVGFGKADREGLERLTSRTGGMYFDAGDVANLVETLRKALAAILHDRKEVRLRPELTRLLSRSVGSDPVWLRHLSIDEWDEPETWSDETHVRFPVPSESTIGAYRTWFEGYRKGLQALLESQVKAQSVSGVFPEDVDLVVVGWLHDPAFRAFSPLLLDLFDSVRQRLAASLQGGRYPLILPLVHEAGVLSPAEAAECHAWLTACRNAGGAQAPKTVTVCGETNLHRVLNPNGYSGRNKRTVVQQAANSIRALALDPNLITQIVGYQSPGAWPLRSVGTTTVDTGFGRGRQREMVEVLEAQVLGFEQRKGIRDREHDAAKQRFGGQGLSVHSVKDSVFAAPDTGSPQGILASVHLEVSNFWPPPSGQSLESYLAQLPLMIEQRGAEVLARKLEALRRTATRRFEDLFSAATAGFSSDVDRYCFGRDDAGVGPAALYCEFLLEMVEAQTQAISQVRDGVDGALQWLFASDEAAVDSAGTRDPQAARQQLEDLIKRRPLPEAFALRYGLLSVVAGYAAYRIASLLQAAGGLAPGLAIVLPGVVGAALAGTGYLLWRHYWARLETAVREYIASLVRAARQAAIQEAVDFLQGFYDRLTHWIGADPIVPAWSSGSVRSEGMLSERQRITSLAEHLAHTARQSRKQLEENLPPPNPFVLESGCQTEEIAAGLPKVTIPPAAGESRLSVPWSSIGVLDENRGWRQVCRRKRCDTLSEFLAYHGERLELPLRLRRRLEDAAAQSQRESRRVSETLSPERFLDWEKLARVLDVLSFPPLRLEEAPPIAPVDLAWLGHPDEVTRLRNSAGGSSAIADRLRQAIGPIDSTWELHRVFSQSCPVGYAADWELFAGQFRSLDEADRIELLTQWGDPASWIDVESGNPCVSQATDTSGTDESGEEGL